MGVYRDSDRTAFVKGVPLTLDVVKDGDGDFEGEGDYCVAAAFCPLE